MSMRKSKPFIAVSNYMKREDCECCILISKEEIQPNNFTAV